MLATSLLLLFLASPQSVPSPAPRGPIQELEEELARRPGDGAVLYALAMFNDRLGQVDEALRWLERLASSPWDAGVDPSDFASAARRSAERFAAAKVRLDRRAPVVASAREVLRVRERDLLPEGLEFDPASGDYLLSSGRHRKVVRVTREGRVSDVVGSGQDGLLATLGLRLDRGRGVLWVASAAAPFMVGASEVPSGLSRLHAFDLASGRLRARFEHPGPSLLNDVAVLPDGRAVVTDSAGDGLLVTAGDRLEPLLPPGTLSSPNGLCASNDGALLYVATFRGIFVVDWRARRATALRLPPGSTSLAGIDGLYLHQDTLLGIQNAVGRPRLVRVPLHADGRGGLGVTVLETGSPIVDNPTTGAVVESQFVFLARRNRETSFLRPDGPALEDVVLASVPLGEASSLLIENVTVVSPEQERPLPGRFVHVVGGRIASVSAAALPVGPRTRRLDGRGKFLAPGLMDSHVHVTMPAGLPLDDESPDLIRLRDEYDRQQPRSYLHHGVTQVLDAAQFGSLSGFEAQPLRPDLFRCGAAPVLDGYPRLSQDGKPGALLPDFVVEPANADPVPAGVDPGQHTPEAVVARIARSGARCVKVFVEDGFGERHDLPLLAPATLARLRRAAHDAGLVLVAHANALDMQQLAVAAEVDVIAHGMWNWGPHRGEPGVPGEIEALLQVIRERRIGFMPTLRVMAGLRELFLKETLADPALRRVVPPGLLDFYGSPAGRFFADELRTDFAGAPDDRIARIQLGVSEQGARVARRLHELGHPLLLASDTPSAPIYSNQPGLNTFLEMRALAAAGIPLDAVLRAGTVENARQFGLDGDYGTVAPGQVANLLLLDADPLRTIEAWDRIDQVILHGEPIPRASLAAPPR